VMSRLRKTPKGPYNPWNWDYEAGDRVYEPVPLEPGLYYMYDLRESRGRNKRDAGELTPVAVKKNGKQRKASYSEDGWYWKEVER